MEQFSGLDYIKIDIANNFGHDKFTWMDRIAWVDHQDNLYEAVEQAKEPMLMVKSINAMCDAMEGVPTGFISSMDATGSGVQIMACLMNCKTTAEQVNLVDTGMRRCLYSEIAYVMDMEKDVETQTFVR